MKKKRNEGGAIPLPLLFLPRDFFAGRWRLLSWIWGKLAWPAYHGSRARAWSHQGMVGALVGAAAGTTMAAVLKRV